MLVQCPYCRNSVEVNGLGRKPLNIPVINVFDALRLHRSIPVAADSLSCSRVYIYKVLKQHGMTVRDIVNTEGKQATPGK
jgi:hypothetical protein